MKTKGLVRFTMICLLSAGLCRAANVLIIDPVHCESGDFCAMLTEQVGGLHVERVDLGSLEGAAKQNWDAIILVKPDPADYSAEIGQQLRSIITREKTGVIIFGLGAVDGGNMAAFELLGKRSPAKQGTHYERYFENCSWIWSAETKASSTVFFRKSFELSAVPAKAGLLISVDDKRRVWINGEEVGNGGGWDQAEFIDAAGKLRAGKNAVCIEARNDGGAAGVIVSILGYGSNGREHVAIHSNSSWKNSENADPNWLNASFDDSKWADSAEIAKIGIAFVRLAN